MNGDGVAPVRVLFVAGTLGHGGAERQLHAQATLLAQAGHTPEVATFVAGEHWEQPLRDLGVVVHDLASPSNPAARTARLCALLRRRRPDVVQAAHFFVNLHVAAAGRATGTPDIGAVRGATRQAVAGLGRAGRVCLVAPRALACNSRHAAHEAIELGVPRDRVHVLPNVVDLDRFHPSVDPPGPDFTVLTVGRLIASKRHDAFLRVVAELVDQLGPATTVRGRCLGDGPERDGLLALVEELGTTGSTTVEPAQDPAPAYRSAAVMVMTSEHEGTPNVLLEAMACAVPVVAFDAPGVSEVVHDGVTGYLVPFGDVRALRDRIVELAHDPDHRAALGANGRRWVAERHSERAVADALGALHQARLGRVPATAIGTSV